MRSFFSAEKNDSAIALMPLCCQFVLRGVFVLVGQCFQDGEDFACEVSFEAVDGVSLAFAFLGAVL